MTPITMTELESESIELLPEKETLWFNTKWAGITATNSSLALNAATFFSNATATSQQMISVNQ
ncbi:hypothetical protein [Intrasporangium oryzae]|uniref:hypothetical protein n=1 Tax=Intrasporangium oryzae TaxID=412687 RepID=UPI0012F72003|nr:hypothetical protein [Intrasporangium oryzae]